MNVVHFQRDSPGPLPHARCRAPGTCISAASIAPNSRSLVSTVVSTPSDRIDRSNLPSPEVSGRTCSRGHSALCRTSAEGAILAPFVPLDRRLWARLTFSSPRSSLVSARLLPAAENSCQIPCDSKACTVYRRDFSRTLRSTLCLHQRFLHLL